MKKAGQRITILESMNADSFQPPFVNENFSMSDSPNYCLPLLPLTEPKEKRLESYDGEKPFGTHIKEAVDIMKDWARPKKNK